jgi:hypothetical protein
MIVNVNAVTYCRGRLYKRKPLGTTRAGIPLFPFRPPDALKV